MKSKERIACSLNRRTSQGNCSTFLALSVNLCSWTLAISRSKSVPPLPGVRAAFKDAPQPPLHITPQQALSTPTSTLGELSLFFSPPKKKPCQAGMYNRGRLSSLPRPFSTPSSALNYGRTSHNLVPAPSYSPFFSSSFPRPRFISGYLQSFEGTSPTATTPTLQALENQMQPPRLANLAAYQMKGSRSLPPIGRSLGSITDGNRNTKTRRLAMGRS